VSKSENSVPLSKTSMILDVCCKGSDRAILAQAMPSPTCMFLEGPACGVPKKTNAQLVRSQLRSLYNTHAAVRCFLDPSVFLVGPCIDESLCDKCHLNHLALLYLQCERIITLPA
jgi:hypothetical protein